MKEKKQKKQKNKKIPFYAKPLEKILNKVTDTTVSYLYEFSKVHYNETLNYEDWLVKVKDFMKMLNENSLNKED